MCLNAVAYFCWTDVKKTNIFYTLTIKTIDQNTVEIYHIKSLQ